MQWKHNMQEVTITWALGDNTTTTQQKFGTHCAEHALDMRPKSRRAKVWIPPALPPSKNCVVLPSTSEHNISDDAARTVAAISGPTNQHQLDSIGGTIMKEWILT